MYDDFNLDQEEDNWRVIGGDAADHSDDEQSMVSGELDSSWSTATADGNYCTRLTCNSKTERQG